MTEVHDGVNNGLRRLRQALEDAGESELVHLVVGALSADQHTRNRFLVSNELWGGAGSIADQAGLVRGARQPQRREIERALIDLGEEQARIGRLNVRTLSWVEAFKGWRRDSV
jgi:hypothetical protein